MKVDSVFSMYWNWYSSQVMSLLGQNHYFF